MNSYVGKLLIVDLTTGKTYDEPLNETYAAQYIGGAGLAARYLYDAIDASTDPLAPDNPLIFMTGPLDATPAPSCGRFVVVARSPLTSLYGEANAGNFFGPDLKLAGYDGIIVRGKSSTPVYLLIRDGKVELRDAKHLLGETTFDTGDTIRAELNEPKLTVAAIGPAGENLVKYAMILSTNSRGKKGIAGRCGLGAVMGSKNLKAIAIRGTTPVSIASKDKFKGAHSGMLKAMKDSPVLYPEFSHHGTPLVTDLTGAMGVLPAKNWTATGEFVPIEGIGRDALASRKIGREHCHDCPVACCQLRVAKTGAYAGILTEGPDFETVYSFGSGVGIGEADPIIAADRLADELGLDSISAGVTISFAMELYERGILTLKDTDGIDLRFGNDAAMIQVLRKMAFRDGLGDILADGSLAAARKIGKDTEKYAMQIKGLELPGYDVRGLKGHGLGFATSYTGADHCRGYAFQEVFGIPIPWQVDRFATEGKGKLTMWNQDVRTVTLDCAPMCAFLLDMVFPATACQNTATLMEAVTGLVLTPKQVQQVGERVNNLARAFNVREGFTRADDAFPERLMTEPLKAGGSKGHRISRQDLDQMLDEYYSLRGWDIKTGKPTREKLTELGLGYVADALGV